MPGKHVDSACCTRDAARELRWSASTAKQTSDIRPTPEGRGARAHAALGEPIHTEGELIVETVQRFKGQSADCIVVTGIDFEAWSDDVRRRLYVAMTWARLELALVVSPAAERLPLDRLDT